jgi:hypothetical protein
LNGIAAAHYLEIVDAERNPIANIAALDCSSQGGVKPTVAVVDYF